MAAATFANRQLLSGQNIQDLGYVYTGNVVNAVMNDWFESLS